MLQSELRSGSAMGMYSRWCPQFVSFFSISSLGGQFYPEKDSPLNQPHPSFGHPVGLGTWESLVFFTPGSTRSSIDLLGGR